METSDKSLMAPNREKLGRRIGWVIIAGSLLAATIAIWSYKYRPQTDDATLRANLIGVAPSVSGQIVELKVQDNQAVEAGELLFVIDPRPFEHALEKARAGVILAHKEVSGLEKMVTVAEASILRAQAQVVAGAADVDRYEAQRISAEAAVLSAEGEFKEADNHFKRIEPLLAKEFATEDVVDAAGTRRLVAATGVTEKQKSLSAAISAVGAARAQHSAAQAALAQAQAERLRAEDAIGLENGVNGRIAAAEAQLQEAELNLEYCRVRAPFSGKVVNMNLSTGAFARAGVDVFTLVDTRTWYAIANFRESQLKHIDEGAPAEVYLQFKGGRRFRGRVVGLAWAVVPENGSSAMGLPNVPRNLDWVRLEQRFPVRIQLDDSDAAFRVGASAVVTITGPAPKTAPVANR